MDNVFTLICLAIVAICALGMVAIMSYLAWAERELRKPAEELQKLPQWGAQSRPAKEDRLEVQRALTAWLGCPPVTEACPKCRKTRAETRKL